MTSALARKKLSHGEKRRAGAVREVTNDPAWPLAVSREEWLRQLRVEYTPAVCAQTLAVNESLPAVSGES
ncbi:MAG: hypothetical protein HY302_14790 [Opitutae bacterium]|nr:hypothetical protein [Opitutae bacterium]